VVQTASAALSADLQSWLDSSNRIYDNQRAQPLVCIAAMATWAVLREMLPAPLAIAGYSVGELAAYGLADALDVAELARLAAARAQFMDEAHGTQPGALLAVRGLTRAEVRRIAEQDDAYIAIAVNHDVFVIGARSRSLDSLQARVSSLGAQVTALRIGVAAHTPLLHAAAERFRGALIDSRLKAPECSVIAGIDGTAVTARQRAIDALTAQIDHTIEWGYCLDTLFERGCRIFLEVGPGRALARIARERLEGVEARSVEDFGSLEAAAMWVRQRLT
jgi:[acyl-carrier-protein] S-malonyltransferase